MSRFMFVVLLVAAFGIAPVSAQEPARPLTLAAVDLATPSGPSGPSRPPVSSLVAENATAASTVVDLPNGIQRPTTSINLLCVSFAALQALDLHSTFRALGTGAQESNPVLGGFANNKAAMIGVKAATTVGTIYLVRKFGVKNRVASTILMAAANSAYAIIVAHNYRVAGARR